MAATTLMASGHTCSAGFLRRGGVTRSSSTQIQQSYFPRQISPPCAAHVHRRRNPVQQMKGAHVAAHWTSAARRQLRAGPLRAADGESATAEVQLPEAQPVKGEGGRTNEFPNTPGVYIVYDKEDVIQYVGMSRKVGVSVGNHLVDLPDKVHSVAVVPVSDGSKAALTEAWQQTVQAAVTATGKVPPGNAKGEKSWTTRRAVKKAEIRLTPGKGIEDLTVPLEEIIQQVVDQNRVVAFVKGTRTAPECGFSHQVLTLLNASRVEYEVVNVLDDIHNPGLRETLKTFSQWPTIPQLYVDGEFVGGADILVEMAGKGELNPLLRGSS
mmetsp:Transcript_11199/g.33595  ORF Transcript_11199/g.33595 Transcript_11199/m.33595 type:complete len:325 (+) Transcript_11199:332-1306(+)